MELHFKRASATSDDDVVRIGTRKRSESASSSKSSKSAKKYDGKKESLDVSAGSNEGDISPKLKKRGPSIAKLLKRNASKNRKSTLDKKIADNAPDAGKVMEKTTKRTGLESSAHASSDLDLGRRSKIPFDNSRFGSPSCSFDAPCDYGIATQTSNDQEQQDRFPYNVWSWMKDSTYALALVGLIVATLLELAPALILGLVWGCMITSLYYRLIQPSLPSFGPEVSATTKEAEPPELIKMEQFRRASTSAILSRPPDGVGPNQLKLPELSQDDWVNIDLTLPPSMQMKGVTFKGWLNLLSASTYDPQDYHVAKTQTVFVQLIENTLRIYWPKQHVNKHAIWNEVLHECQFVRHQMYNISGCRIVLRPERLARRRWWSRKYPILIESAAVVSFGRDSDNGEDSDTEPGLLRQALSRSMRKKSPRARTVSGPTRNLYFFARAAREKEYWFQRLRLATSYCEQLKRCSSTGSVQSAESAKESEPPPSPAPSLGSQASQASSAPGERLPPDQPAFRLSSPASSSGSKDKTPSPIPRATTVDPPLSAHSRTPSLYAEKVVEEPPVLRPRCYSDSKEQNGLLRPPSEGSVLGTGVPSGFLTDEARLYWQTSNDMTVALQRFFSDFLGLETAQASVGQDGRVSSCQLAQMKWSANASPAPAHIPPSNSAVELRASPSQDKQLTILWANAFASRFFWDWMCDAHMVEELRCRIQRKLSTIRLPYFIETLTVTKLHPGLMLPRITDVSQPVMNEWGLWVDFAVQYSGGVKMELETKVNLMKLKTEPVRSAAPPHSAMTYSDSEAPESPESSDDEPPPGVLDSFFKKKEDKEEFEKKATSQKFLTFVDKMTHSKYFQEATDIKFIQKVMQGISDTPLAMTVELRHLDGTLALNVPAPPTSRVWYGFRPLPLFSLRVLPRVGEKAVTIQPVTEWIENKLKQVFERVLVMPNMDDLIVPLMTDASVLKTFNL